MKIFLKNESELQEFGRKLGEKLQEGDVLDLRGDMGAGKTTLTRGIARGLLVKEAVTSPTFGLVHIYSGNFPLYHLDFYRMEEEDEILDLDYEAYFYPDGVTVLEWSSRVASYLPKDLIRIDIEKKDGGRELLLYAETPREKELERQMQ